MSRAKPITPVAWHPLDAVLGGQSFSRACEALCGGADSDETKAVVAAARVQHMYIVDDGVREVIAMLLAQEADIENRMCAVGLVLIAAAKSGLLLRGRTETEINETILGIEAGLEDSMVLAALNQLQRGH